jgi:hypothetical protein
MRPQRTYRADRKRRARERGITLAELDAQDRRAKELAAQRVHQLAMSMSSEQARHVLGIWARSGGKINLLNGVGVPDAAMHGVEFYRDGESVPAERVVYDALKEPAPEGTPHLDGAVGEYQGVTIHGRR